MLAKHALYQLSYGPILKPLPARAVVRPNPPEDPRGNVVGPGRLELPTSRLSGVCSNQLSYRPLKRHVPDREVKNTRSHHSLNRSAAVFYGKRNEDGDTLHLFSVIERTNRA